ncbi:MULTISPECIES: DUF433 domain-containing protein [unclassified Microcoleus]|uniref:DUF433 domain-containing protein n=2 Tax=Microcoleus TaxID=44471 RepID=UPI001DED7CB9|nr:MULTISPECIES: DUF433 domain-containing protein [unclassified Microcoleus]MCC3469674.1 DUF433 domain-containing protein [Microcoleus sp. PH2017_06_SFM_O_A]TAE09787.1 MAG: DUF433 domain-containing protein [Oscillatoriales cyanobacterium]MCC3414600.1 DUF433 domain-containing protein [Microcoleus sp. PH2017_02_FOX_O_A]MCC3492442.1 DUF433 domain-containing protein [Microcoleus sp. PH2017_16_JOR_D_A]MCC3518114.1 DUF433 domain-containing protein [Microcoleus sp. PH2017_18_LLB_O_A]
MQLEDYFEFLTPEDIRIKGTRVGIEHILYEYIHRCQTPEAIAQKFRTVTMAQVYATILYYLENTKTVGKYVGDWLEYCLKAEAEYDRNPSPFVLKMRQIKEQNQKSQQLDRVY